MISVEQILLLQQKVESAVQKIEQLKSENDALRTKCSELTKALSEKSELLSAFSADEKKIEDGILSALSRLDSVENTLLNQAAVSAAQTTQAAPVADNAAAAQAEQGVQPVPTAQSVQTAQSAQVVTSPDEKSEPVQAAATSPDLQESIQVAKAADLSDTITEQGEENLSEDDGGDLFGDITTEDDSAEDTIEPSVDIF